MLETAIEAARRAGQLIAERYPGGRDASYKGHRDLVTATDIAAENAILRVVRDRFPAHTILSEESEGGKIGDGYTWVVDPLDGTSNFTHRVPIFAVSIGVLEHGDPLLGVVHDPMRDHLFVASRGSGAWLNDQPLRTSPLSNLRTALVGLDWARGDDGRRRVLANLRRVAPRCQTVRILGSAVLGLAYVASGWLDAYFHVALHPWDAAAAVLLISEAGGRCTTFSGEPYHIGLPNCAATNGHLHEELLELLPGE
ncbi:MAG: inositol monophosphatase family protein [Anaerolineae bacterium]